MHSSTFNSEELPVRNRAYQPWVIALVAGIVLFLAGIEAAARFVFPRTSRIAARVRREQAKAGAIGKDGGSEHTVLLVGNSLMLEGLNVESLRAGLPPGWRLVRFVVEQADYLDWYYGLRRLFAEGARPQVVAIMLSPAQTIADSIRGEFFARHLMQLSDLGRLTHELKLHPTRETGLAFGNLSEFYGSRAEVRNWLLLRIMPQFDSVARLLIKRAPIPADNSPYRAAAARLRAMREEVEIHQARFVWLLPPGLHTKDADTGLLEAAQAAGVTVVSAVPSDSLPAADFSDGIHLTGPGREIYTSKLVPLMREYLNGPR